MSVRNDFLTLAQHLTDAFGGCNKPNNRLDSFLTVFMVLCLDKSNKLIYKTKLSRDKLQYQKLCNKTFKKGLLFEVEFFMMP